MCRILYICFYRKYMSCRSYQYYMAVTIVGCTSTETQITYVRLFVNLFFGFCCFLQWKIIHNLCNCHLTRSMFDSFLTFHYIFAYVRKVCACVMWHNTIKFANLYTHPPTHRFYQLFQEWNVYFFVYTAIGFDAIWPIVNF